jgi:hypothetical protein
MVSQTVGWNPLNGCDLLEWPSGFRELSEVRKSRVRFPKRTLHFSVDLILAAAL